MRRHWRRCSPGSGRAASAARAGPARRRPSVAADPAGWRRDAALAVTGKPGARGSRCRPCPGVGGVRAADRAGVSGGRRGDVDPRLRQDRASPARAGTGCAGVAGCCPCRRWVAADDEPGAGRRAGGVVCAEGDQANAGRLRAPAGQLGVAGGDRRRSAARWPSPRGRCRRTGSRLPERWPVRPRRCWSRSVLPPTWSGCWRSTRKRPSCCGATPGSKKLHRSALQRSAAQLATRITGLWPELAPPAAAYPVSAPGATFVGREVTA